MSDDLRDYISQEEIDDSISDYISALETQLAKARAENKRLRLVRERVNEFAVRATKEREMTQRDDATARQTESMGAQLLEVIELAEQ